MARSIGLVMWRRVKDKIRDWTSEKLGTIASLGVARTYGTESTRTPWGDAAASELLSPSLSGHEMLVSLAAAVIIAAITDQEWKKVPKK